MGVSFPHPVDVAFGYVTHFDQKYIRGYGIWHRNTSKQMLFCTCMGWFILSSVPIFTPENFIFQIRYSLSGWTQTLLEQNHILKEKLTEACGGSVELKKQVKKQLIHIPMSTKLVVPLFAISFALQHCLRKRKRAYRIVSIPCWGMRINYTVKTILENSLVINKTHCSCFCKNTPVKCSSKYIFQKYIK